MPAALAHAPPPQQKPKPFHVDAKRFRRRVSARLGAPAGVLARAPAWWGAAHWCEVALPAAYRRGGSRHHPVTLATAQLVARAFAGYADRRTGRGCHPTNEQVAELAHCSVRTVQRVRRLLEDLGLMVVVQEGRSVMTYEQRIQAWRNGSCTRALAAEVALTLPRELARIHSAGPRPVDGVTPPRTPVGGSGSSVNPGFLTSKARRMSGAPRRAQHRRPPPGPLSAAGARSQRLIAGVQTRIRWLSGVSPRRLTSLHRFAAQRWTPRDVQLALDQVLRARGWTVPDHVEQPAAYLALLLREVDPGDRPGALEEARIEEERIRRAWAARVRAADAPLCRHGEPLGNTPHPLSGVRSCPLCRRS